MLDTESFETVQVEQREDRVIAKLNRPEVRNAIDDIMVEELHAICAYLEVKPKVLILTGSQRDEAQGTKAVFASGADISQLRDRRRAEGLRGINAYVFQRIARLPMPVIAALDGYALGGGAELAMAADFRIGTPQLKLGNPETGLGIMAAAGATWRLIEVVGEAIAKEMLLAGSTLSGEECLDAGAITQLVESEGLMDAVHALADRIGQQDPLAVQVTKTVLRMPRSAHPEVDTIAQALLFESEQKFDRMDTFLARRNSRKV